MGHCKIHDVRWINKEESTDECYRCVFIQRNELLERVKDCNVLLQEVRSVGYAVNPRMKYEIDLVYARIHRTLGGK